VKKQLKSVEVWISDATQCPVRQTFHMPDGGFRTAQFSALAVNPKLPGNIAGELDGSRSNRSSAISITLSNWGNISARRGVIEV
jgi:hypothetical protein